MQNYYKHFIRTDDQGCMMLHAGRYLKSGDVSEKYQQRIKQIPLLMQCQEWDLLYECK